MFSEKYHQYIASFLLVSMSKENGLTSNIGIIDYALNALLLKNIFRSYSRQLQHLRTAKHSSTEHHLFSCFRDPTLPILLKPDTRSSHTSLFPF